MARVVRRKVKGKAYVQVVEDYKVGRTWKQKVLGSFGSADDPDNLAKAIHFMGEVNAFKNARAEYADQFDDVSFLEKPWVKVLGAGVLTFLGGAAGYAIGHDVARRRQERRDRDVPEAPDDSEE